MRGVEPEEMERSTVCVTMGRGRITHHSAAPATTKPMPNVIHRPRQNHAIAAPAV